MKNILVFIFIGFFSMAVFAQQQSRADRFFEKGDYINAAKEYAEQLNNGEYTKHNFENIAISYYNTFQFRKAYRALTRVTSGKYKDKDKTYDNEFNFKMYQVLSALGEYDKAVVYLEKYSNARDQNAFNTEVAIANIEAFKLKEDDFTVKNAAGLNSTASEFGAVKRDSMVYFTSDRKANSLLDKNYRWTHRPFLNIYKVAVDTAYTPLAEVASMSASINTKLHEGNFCFSADGKTMYLSRSNQDKGRKKFDSLRRNVVQLYKSSLKDSVWSKPEKMLFNSKDYTVQHPALSADGKKLFFASNMPGGYGDYDLYYINVNEDGSYGEPQNLGETINTPNREQFPFISNDGHLFFSSNGHLGLGMMDVFVAKSMNATFEEPLNLGAPINSSYDDFSFNYFEEGKGFFASNRNKKSDEIYSFNQIGEVFLRPYNARFEVRDAATKNYIPNAKLELLDKEENTVFAETTDSISAVNKDLTPGRHLLKTEATGYFANEKSLWVKEKEGQVYTVFLNKDKNYLEETNAEPLAVAQSEVGTSTPTQTNTEKSDVTPIANTPQMKKKLLEDTVGPPVIEKDGKLFFELPPIYFDFDKWNIRADSKKVLDELALKLEKYKSVSIKIKSHTDNRGTATYNQFLSEKRAEATRNYLALIGYVNARRMEFEGFGESQLLVPCSVEQICTEDEHQINRRSEFEILKY